jgi:uncharacterized protein (DUF1810 family)
LECNICKPERFRTAQRDSYVTALREIQNGQKLFALADPDCPVFRKVLDKFFNGEYD